MERLLAKVGMAIPDYRGSRKAAVKYVEELKKATRMFEAETLSYAQEMIGDTQRHKAGTVGELLAFMRKYSLMFGAADLIENGGEKYARLYGLLQQQKEKLGIKADIAIGPEPARLVRLLIITGDEVDAHAWRETTSILRSVLTKQGRINVDLTATPAKDLTKDRLAEYDVFLLNYKDTNKGSPDSRWDESNKAAFLDAIRGGKGLVVYHYASGAFIRPNWEEFEKAISGGFRTQGFHGPIHPFVVKTSGGGHVISEGLPARFAHAPDELYQNSMLTPGSLVLATAYSDPALPRGSGRDEPVIWVNQYGLGRVFHMTLGHGAPALTDQPVQTWLRRGAEWAATGHVNSSTK